MTHFCREHNISQRGRTWYELSSLVQAVPTEVLLAVPVVGVGAIGAGALLFKPEPPIESTMGAAFTSKTVTPYMAQALEDKKMKASLKYKYVDPVLDAIDERKEAIEERFAAAKKEVTDKVEKAKFEADKAKKDKAEAAARDKKEREEAAARIKGIDEGKLIALPLPLGLEGVVVPNPLAAAKELLPGGDEAAVEEKKGLKDLLPF